MDLNERIKSLSKWGEQLQNIPSAELLRLFEKARNKNAWFTLDSCERCLKEIIKWLQYESLVRWTGHYNFHNSSPSKSIGLVMAGNIPLVGFHDLLSVLISGHSANIKLSSQDDELLPYLTKVLVDSNAEWENNFAYSDRLKNIDAVIATGSDNSSRYFEHYFKSIPRIVRSNRTSVGIILGEESSDEFENLASDIFIYFGMGCRNVSKIFIPEKFDFGLLNKPFSGYQDIINVSKYGNNYDYQKAIRLMSSKPFHDTGFLILEESKDLVSPIAVLYYQYYSTQEQLKELLDSQKSKIQCMVSAQGWLKGSIPFGKAQQPELGDYADGVDTLKFLLEL